MKHETARAIVIGAIVGALLLAGCAACHSARGANEPTNDTELIVSNQRAISHLEAAVDYLEGTASRSHERIGEITETGATIADAVDRLEYLFGCYESEVDQLLREIEQLRADLEEARASYPSGGDPSNSGNSSEGSNPSP